MNLGEITFDESDKNLFQVDDPRLRADALKHSILPRLRRLLDECVSIIRRVYGTEALEDSTISYYPQFRPNRENELKFLYEAAYAGLGGKRVKGKWLGVERKKGKPVQYLPFRYGLQLTEEGLVIFFENYWLTGLTNESYKKFFDFHLNFESLLHTLCYKTGIKPDLYFGEDVGYISTFKKHYEFMYNNGIFENNYRSALKYPINSYDLLAVIDSFACFYPVYDSYLQISMGKPVRFLELIETLNEWKIKEWESEVEEDVGQNHFPTPENLSLKAMEAAEQRIRVMPAMRWQVFQRDNWKCTACGRGSHDNIILHVDHIIPRSKGGKDELTNYQTLCHLCNIGKSNRDETDLRNRK